MTPKPREQYEVTYQQGGKATLNIITANLQAAQAGDLKMQASMAWQYFKALGRPTPPAWDWKWFNFRPLGRIGRPPRKGRKGRMASVPPPVAKPAPVQEQCCEGCFVCDELNDHHRCSRGCTIGVGRWR